MDLHLVKPTDSYDLRFYANVGTSFAMNLFPDMELDLFGQNDRLNGLYTQLCFCFPLSDTFTAVPDTLVDSLKESLHALVTGFPWIAGQVIQDTEGVYKMTPYHPLPELRVQTIRGQLPSYAQLRDAGFPFRFLDEKVIAPRRTLPERSSEPAEVFLVQANFVEGGLLLVLMGQHNCMDIAGLSQVIRLLAKASRGEAFSGEDLEVGNLFRKDIIPVGHHVSTGSKPTTKSNTASELSKVVTPTEARAVWAYFTFSPSSIAKLKADANDSKTAVSFVSTDDVISAVLWQAWTRVRVERLGTQHASSTFQRQVNVRKHLGLPAEYTGVAVYTVSTTFPVFQICDISIGVIASELRKTLKFTEIERETKAAAASIAQSKDRKTAAVRSASRSTLPPFTVKMSSWAKEGCYDFDFGPRLGRAEAVRRPAFDAWDGLAYLLPRKLDGEVVAAICAREDDLANVKKDAVLEQFARFIG